MNTFTWPTKELILTNSILNGLSISGGTYVNNTPSYLPGETYKIKGQLYTAFTSTATYQDVSITLEDYPIDAQGYPNAPANTETFFFPNWFWLV
jgi:hypothetical protein